MNLLNNKKNVFILDIDGTIKDLVKENTEALIYAMKKLNRVDLKFRGKFVLWVNKVNMYFIKTGFLPTNSFMQKLLLLMYSILLFKNYPKFKKIYFRRYNKEHIFFHEISEALQKLHESEKELYLVTKNVQNKNILKCLDLDVINSLVIAENNKSKYHVYYNIINKLKLEKESIVIVGDNLCDDIIPALILGVDVIWCNMYGCRLKQIATKILSTINKKVFYVDSVKDS